MKVLHLTNNYPTTRFPISGIFVKEQVDSLTKCGVENEVYLINGRENGKKEYLKQIILIRKYLKQNSYDVIHCHHALSALTLFISGYHKKNVIISFQNDPKNELGNSIFTWLRKKSGIQIFKNNSIYVDSVNGFYLPNGVNTNFFHPMDKQKACNELSLIPEKTYILFMSSNYIRKQKRLDRFKEVISILRNTYNNTNVEELILINEERNKIPYYMNAAALHLLTSDFEGSPNSVKECMACNIPVVSTQVGNVKELLENVNGSFVSDSNNPEELAELVNKALNIKNLDGRKKITDMGLDLDSVAKKLKNIYELIARS